MQLIHPITTQAFLIYYLPPQMKNSIHTKKIKSGMTILEMTVVIVLLMALVSILFIGATSWRRGSDRSSNLLNLRNTQQAMRGHQNLRIDQTINTFGQTDLERYMKFPTALGGGGAEGITYTAGTVFTAKGVLWLTAAYGTSFTGAAPPASLISEW